MTSTELLDLLTTWENMNLISQELADFPEDFEVLMEIALYSEHPKSWRAVWLADKINDNHPELIVPFIEKMIHRLKAAINHSKKRHLLKLISLHEIPEIYLSFLLDYCLRCFTSASETIAVRVHAMQILYNISEKEPGFKSELFSIIQHETELHPTAGIRARGKKLAGKLHHEMKKSGIHLT
jgi:hypothetical protein